MLRVGDEIEIKPGIRVQKGGRVVYEPLTTEVVSIRFGNLEVEEARPGGLMAIGTRLDPSLARADRLIGNVVGKAGTVPDPAYSLTIEYSLMERVVGAKEMIKVQPLRVGEPTMITAGSAVTLGIVTKLGKDVMEARLKRPVVVWEGMRVALSRQIMGRWRLVGWGIIK